MTITQAFLTSEISSLWLDNTIGEITPANARATLNDMVTAIFQGIYDSINVSATGVFTNTQMNLLTTSLLNGIVPGTEFSTWQGGNFATESLTAGVTVPATANIHQVNAIGAYIHSQAGTAIAGGGWVAGYFQAWADADNANMFAINPVLVDSIGLTGVHLQNEFDFNVNNTTTGVTGISLQLGGTAQPASAVAIACQVPSGSTSRWSGFLFSADGAAFQGAYFGASDTPNSVSSQAIVFGGRDAGGILRKPTIFSDLNGSLVLRSGQNGQAVGLQDFNGGTGANLFFVNTSGATFTNTITSGTNGSTGGELTLNGATSGSRALAVNATGTIFTFGGGALSVTEGGTGDTGTAWTTFAPSLVAGTATFTVNSARFKTLGKTTWIELDFTITAIGSGSQPVAFTTPNTVNMPAILAGLNTNGNTGAQCVVFNPTTANVYKDGASNFGTGDRIVLSGVYENQ